MTPTKILLITYSPKCLECCGPHCCAYYIWKDGVKTEYFYYSDEGYNFENVENRKDSFEHAVKWIERVGHIN